MLYLQQLGPDTRVLLNYVGFLCFIMKGRTKKLHNTTSGPFYCFCYTHTVKDKCNFKENSAGTNLLRKNLDTWMNSAL